MKDLFRLLKRFLPPYKSKVWWNFFFNLLSAAFGAVSFMLFEPVLGILFGTAQEVHELMPFRLTKEALLNNIGYFVTWVIDYSGKSLALIYIGLSIIVMVFFKTAFMYLASFVMISIRNGVVRDLRSAIYGKMVVLPLGFFSNERKGDIMARMTADVQEIENSVMNSLDMLFKNPVIILISLAYMISASWSLTLFVLILLPVAGWLIGMVGKSLKRQSRAGQNKLGDILSIIEEDISGLRVIKAFTAEKKAIRRFENENENYRSIMNRLMSRYSLAHPMSEFLGTVVIVIVLWYGGNLVLSEAAGGLSPSEFIIYLVFFYSIINPAKAFSSALYSIEKGLASVERIDKILMQENAIVNRTGAVEKRHFNATIEYRNVSFSYDTEKVLDNVSLTIKKGQTAAFVGKSGSGKTTLVDMLPRFWDIVEGSILLDNEDIRNIKLHDLRGLMGNVNQEPILFNDTFFNNIAFGVENATMEEVVNAAIIANAHDFIMATENGYNANIGDRGDKLSGGQKQRISIARAILKNPPILILDEATSALDTESEKLVQSALESLLKNRTSLVIAHRLSTIRNADVIFVLEKGRLIEAGNHNELLAKRGLYYKLHKIQEF